MQTTDHRILVNQLAEDFGWLEQHARSQTNLSDHVAPLQMAAALVRNVIGPYLNQADCAPLHLAVIGGAGTGKSTVVNFLTGRVIAEANPQAGFTRHPIAYVARTRPDERAELAWSAQLGFLGNLQRLGESAPANLDQDVYQVRRIAPAESEGDAKFGLLRDFVIWDCPDMTTWAAAGYVSRLIEVSALADVIVFVASDERYNDVMPTQYLQLVIKTGKPVVVVLTKMTEAQTQPLSDHFRQEVLSKMPALPDGSRPMIPVLTIPYLRPEQLADPVALASKYRIPLMNQISVLSQPIRAARERSVKLAVHYLQHEGQQLLEVARTDLQAIEAWQALVHTGEQEFDARYRREYLNGEPFRRFDDSRQAVIDLLDFPAAGRVVTAIFWVVRAPYRLLRSWTVQLLRRPDGVNLPEHTVLDGALTGWLDQLRASALQRSDGHAIWKQLARDFDASMGRDAHQEFETNYRRFQLSVADEVEGTRRGIVDNLRGNPGLLFVLRVGKLVADVASVGLALWLGNFSWWLLLFIPVFVSLTHQVVELIVRSYVDAVREQVRLRQEKLVHEHLAHSMALWLNQRPVSGGSPLERLQRVLRAIPDATRTLQEWVAAQMQETRHE